MLNTLTTSEINAIPARLSSEDILQESSVNLQALFATGSKDLANLMQNSTQNLQLTNREDVAKARISFGYSSAMALRDALKQGEVKDEVEYEESMALAWRIRTCSDRENHWVGDDLHNTETGELYTGNGNLWSCGSKLCPSCVAKAANRSRKELRFSLKNYKLMTGEMYQHISLTIVNPGLSLLQTRAVADRSWTLFRKRDYFKQKIRGGSKSEEFTITENGYHYHYHLLCVTRFLNYNEFRREWTDCVEIAYKELNLPFEVKTKDKCLLVEVRRLHSSASSLEGEVQEVCKYITKSDSWEKLPPKDLIEIASIKRFWRMFEIFGSFRTQRNVNVESDNISAFNFKLYYLILSTVGESFRSKDKKRMKRAFMFLLRFCRGQEVFDLSRDTILDTKQISDGENFDEPDNLPEKVPKRRREVSWRKYILENGLYSYYDKLAEQVDKTRYARKCFLSLKYKFATFRTLDGALFSFEQL
jgi:hypothetical protein